jgi:hypothetical protein
MHGFWMLVHMLGFTFWIGGGVATMAAGIASKRFTPEARLASYRLTSAVWRILVGPGVVGVTLSGLVLSMPFMKSGMTPGWMMLMMVTGIVGALIAIGVSLPAAAQLGRLELDPRGDIPEHFHALRSRLVWGSSIAGALALIALLAGTWMKG